MRVLEANISNGLFFLTAIKSRDTVRDCVWRRDDVAQTPNMTLNRALAGIFICHDMHSGLLSMTESSRGHRLCRSSFSITIVFEKGGNGDDGAKSFVKGVRFWERTPPDHFMNLHYRNMCSRWKDRSAGIVKPSAEHRRATKGEEITRFLIGTRSENQPLLETLSFPQTVRCDARHEDQAKN
jgi:hypothetical protein